MVGLCHELLALEISGDYPVEAFTALGGLLSVEFRPTLQGRTLDQVVECLRKAVRTCPPGVHNIHLEFATSLQFRFLQTPSDGDYHDAMEVLEEIVAPDRLGDNPSSHSVEACILMARFTIFRCNEQERPEYIEEALSRCHSWFDYPTLGPEGYPVVKLLLDWCLAKRSDGFSRMGLREKFDDLLMFIPFTPTRSLRHPITSEALVFARVDVPWAFEQCVHNLPRTREEIPEAWWHVSAVTFARALKAADTGDIKDIEDAIEFRRTALQVASVHAPRSAAETEHCVSLGQLLRQAFDCDRRVEYLEESISVDRHALKITVPSSSSHFKVLRRLSKSLIDSWQLQGRMQDLDESMQLCHVAIDDESMSAPNRLDWACEWASRARDTGHSTVLTAYQAAMSLMESTLVFTPTLEMQHILLASKEAISQMPLEYASYLIHICQPEQAIEVLEQGRSLLWSEMRGFRTSIDQLRRANQDFSDRLVEINQQLEDLTTTTLKDEIGGDGIFAGASFRDGKFEDGLGRIHKQQRELLRERDTLISRIRGLPGFETFLGTPRFETVRDAASRGPVIIINDCRWRCDILVLLHDSSPSLIPTADDFYDCATKLKEKLLNTRKEFLPGSREYEDALRSVLKELYKLVGQPVIDRLRELKVEEQSRVWWCPTSVFCALPLHAMGPIPSAGGEERYFSDLYVSSYTPTLSALIQSRAPGSTSTSDRPSLLLIGRPNDNLPGVWREIKAIQAHLGKNAHCLVSDDATVDAVTGGLQRHPFLHLACHGYLETGRPFDAWFKLRGEGRLTLLDIVRSRLPSAEFAFLSACHSAELTEQSIADEALHLAAAMQYSGFRSVVGTMWAVVDDDGPELAKHFYKTMSSNQGKKAPGYRRSARALRNAVQKLRQKRGVSLERWVNFVHYGA